MHHVSHDDSDAGMHHRDINLLIYKKHLKDLINE